MSERFNIQIDYCPSCRGIWLDKGELEKMLDVAAQKADAVTGSDLQKDRHDDYDYEEKRRKDAYGKPNKKKSFLGDLFDFD